MGCRPISAGVRVNTPLPGQPGPVAAQAAAGPMSAQAIDALAMIRDRALARCRYSLARCRCAADDPTPAQLRASASAVERFANQHRSLCSPQHRPRRPV